MLGQSCDACGSRQTVPLFDNTDYLSGERFTVVRCADCGLARTVFPHDADALARYYGPAYYGEDGRRFIGVMEWAVRQFRLARVRRIRRLRPDGTPGAILDVGCGRGLILIHLRAHGWQCSGVEVSEALAERLHRDYDVHIYTAPHLPDNHLPAESQDVILLWHSLEHAAYPAQTIAECARLLRPGGRMIVEVPNLMSWQARLGGGRWFHLDTPRHLYHFSTETLSALSARHGLRVTAQTTLSLEQGFYGMIQTFLNRFTRRPNVLYRLLKRQAPRGRGAALDIGVTLALLPFVVPLAVLVESLAVLARCGAVIQLTLEKPCAAT